MVGGSVALTNVNVELDGNVAEGVMTFANNGRQTLQATLAAGNLDFTPYISTVRLLASGARDWNRQLFDLNALSATDLDMRLSAAKVTIGHTKLGRTAFGANLRSGALALSHRRGADVWRHRQRVRSASGGPTPLPTCAPSSSSPTSTCRPACTELFGINKLSGRGNLNVSLVASGASPFGLASSLDGTALLTGHDGAIAGFNVEQLLKRLERRPLSGGGNFRQGSTPYDSLTVRLKFADGIATTEDVRVEGPAAKLSLTGTASVPSREYDMKGVASLISGRCHGRLRTAVRGAGPVGRSPDLPGPGKPDPPLAGDRAPARCGQGQEDPRRRQIGDRPFYGRRPARARAGRRARGDRSGQAELKGFVDGGAATTRAVKSQRPPRRCLEILRAAARRVRPRK